ncbi:MAG: archease [Candidatus Nanohaloarchaea archaeon]
MSYEILDHTADAKFRAAGAELEDAFKSAVEAFAEIVGTEGGEYRHEIEVESENLEALLFDFLDRLIFLQDSEGVVIAEAEELEIDEKEDSYRLEAKLLVDSIEPGMSLVDVKGPTYSEMEVDYVEGEGWTLQAVLDI